MAERERFSEPVGSRIRSDRGRDDQVEQGGESVCWLPLVCPQCGRLAEAEPPTRCPACGTGIGLDTGEVGR